MRAGVAVPRVAILSGAAIIITAHAEPPSLACGKVSSQLDAVLTHEPPGTVSTLREELLACLTTHRICGVVYDHTQTQAHVFSGEQSSDVPGIEYSKDGASYALMASRSLPPSRKSGLEYCLALTPGDGKSDRQFDWHGWQISAAGEIRALDLSKESTSGVHTNPRSLATNLWNFYAARF